MAAQEQSVASVFSARPDGATSVAVGLAAVLSQTSRVLVIDLCPHGPEVAPLLDVEDSPNVYELSFLARLSPVSATELESHVQWRDGLGVLAGIWPAAGPHEEITDVFVEGLVSAATSRFDHVVVDLGRRRPSLAPALASGPLLWVVTPSPWRWLPRQWRCREMAQEAHANREELAKAEHEIRTIFLRDYEDLLRGRANLRPQPSDDQAIFGFADRAVHEYLRAMATNPT